MSLSSQTRRNDYTGNASVSVYAYSFRVFSEDDIEVIVRDTSDVETTLTKTTDYTVSGVGSSTGGNITLVNASQAWLTGGNLKSNYHLTIRRIVDLVQNASIRNQGTFFPETHEDEFDFLTMIDQQQQDAIDRSVKLPSTILPSVFDPTLPTDITSNQGAALLVNADGDGFVMGNFAFSYSIQGTQPTDPQSTALAFWFDTANNQMKIWCRTEWRVIA